MGKTKIFWLGHASIKVEGMGKTIFFDPWSSIYFFGILPIPGVIFGALYLYYSWYMSKKNTDNIGHDAHFLGALFGFCLPMIIRPALFMDFLDLLFRG